MVEEGVRVVAHGEHKKLEDHKVWIRLKEGYMGKLESSRRGRFWSVLGQNTMILDIRFFVLSCGHQKEELQVTSTLYAILPIECPVSERWHS